MKTLSPGDLYVAMGSSFAAGPGVAPAAPGRPFGSGRSAANYPSLVAERLGLTLRDVSFSGATTAQLRTGGPGRTPPQLDAVTPDTRLVTLTCGGNDVGYLAGLLLGSLTPLALRGRGAGPGEDERFARLAQALDTLLQDVRARAPDATLIVVGYLTVVPPEPCPLAPAVTAWARATADRLAHELESAATRAGCRYVDVPTASTTHHAWSATPWTTTTWTWMPYHPNAAGMRAIAELVLA